MPQMTPTQARVIDPVLTEVARGYQNGKFVGMSLFPYVHVMQRGGKIIQFNKEHFRLYNTARAPGSKVARMQFGYSGVAYALEDHALEGLVPDELSQDAAAVPGIDLGMGAIQGVQNSLGLRLEYQQATIATTAGSYAASNKTTLSGTSQWSDPASDPIADIETGKEAIRSQVGLRPNTVVMGAAVFAKLKTHTKILDRLKYTGRDVATADLLASLFGVDQVLIGDGVYLNNAGTQADIWGKFVVLAYTERGPISAAVPSYGYTYRLTDHPFVEPPYRDPSIKSWVYQMADAVSPNMVGAEAGYLISAAVA
jgi:hypothetical protein